MARFALREFSVPDYRRSLPEKDPNNAIWPRISAFAKMLHDMSWEDSDEEYDDGTGRSEDERAADFEQNARENVKTSEDKKMDGYSEYLDDQSRLTEDEKKTQGAEQQLELERERRNIGFGGDRSGGMDRQRQLAEAAMVEDPDTVARHQSELRNELADVNANAKTRTPSEDGNGYYQMGPDYVKHYQDIIGTPADGDWGPKSKKALKKFMDSQDWSLANDYDAEQFANRMSGHRPLPTR
jgi:hypothetical protein